MRKKRTRNRILERLEDRRLLAVDLLPSFEGFAGSSDPRDFIQVGDYVYFTASFGPANDQLFRTNGTPEGTIALGFSSGRTNSIANGDDMYFYGNGALYRTQGTRESTIRLTDDDQLPRNEQLISFEGNVYFVAEDRASERNGVPYLSRPGMGLMRTDGTAASTDYVIQEEDGRRVSRFNIQGIWDDTLHYQFRGRRDYLTRATDGTAEGTTTLSEVDSSLAGGTPRVELDDVLVGEVVSREGEFEFAIMDKQTGLVSHTIEINPEQGSNPGSFVEFDGNVFFVANDGEHGNELWRTDGTVEGTRLAADVVPGAVGSSPDWLTPYQDAFYFSADNSLWKYNPTDDAIETIYEFEDRASTLGPLWLSVVGDSLYFTADGGEGDELWKSDGTPEGTQIVADLHPGTTGSTPANLTVLNDQLIFSARVPEVGNELWILDPADDSVQLLADLRLGTRPSRPVLPAESYVYQNVSYFRVDDTQHGAELWRSDGTPEGTFMLRDIQQGANGSGPRRFFEFDGLLYFVANDGKHGYELWRTDGTAANTELFKDTWPGSDGVIVEGFVVADDAFYFTATDGEHGVELWKSDGTPEGTGMLVDFSEGAAHSPIRQLQERDGEVFFYIDQSESDQRVDSDLWKWNGTELEIVYTQSELRARIPLIDYTFWQDEIVVFGERGPSVFRYFTEGRRFDSIVSRSLYLPLQTFSDETELPIATTSGMYLLNSEGELVEIEAGGVAHMEVVGDQAFYWMGGNTTSIKRVGLGETEPTEVMVQVTILDSKVVAGKVYLQIEGPDESVEVWTVSGTGDPQKITTLSDQAFDIVALEEKTLFVVPAQGNNRTIVAVENGAVEYTPSEVDALFSAVNGGSTDVAFDLNADASVDTADIDYLFEDVLITDRADFDLNGEVNFADFLVLSTNFGSQNAKWSEGDVNGDGEIAFADFLLLSAAFGKSN